MDIIQATITCMAVLSVGALVSVFFIMTKSIDDDGKIHTKRIVPNADRFWVGFIWSVSTLLSMISWHNFISESTQIPIWRGLLVCFVFICGFVLDQNWVMSKVIKKQLL